ncbi:MAG: NYN domain-containing protein [Deltaproteobacteria bacterium]|nr:NYN domain-containing protein [Deltaproteobacteria bacterium]
MALRLLIDGYNLLGAIASVGHFDIDERREDLIGRLSVYKKVRGAKVTAVFDGTRSGRLTRGREMRAGVEVIFSKDGEDADSVIKELSVKGGSSLTVVSSDRELCSHVKSRGAVTVSSNEFAQLLDLALYEGLKGVAPGDEDEGQHPKKGPSKRPSKQERRGLNRLKKL